MPHTVRVSVSERGGRQYATTGSSWEPIIGYSRAVRAEHTIYVTGTVGIEADGTFSPSLAVQTKRALAIIAASLEALGGQLQDVVRTRIYLTDISKWKEAGEVHGEVFRDIRPATTMVEVSSLIDKDAQVEIEVEAILRSGGAAIL